MKNQMKIVETPWGIAQTETKVASGIVKYTTATHGGYHLSRQLNRKIPKILKQSTFGALGNSGWYEEDSDWAIVVYFFPEHFDNTLKFAALQCLQQFHPDALKLAVQKLS